MPLVLEENNKILLDRKKLFAILNKNNNSKSDTEWLNKKFKQYGVSNKNIPVLKRRMDIIPPSMTVPSYKRDWLRNIKICIGRKCTIGQWTYTDKELNLLQLIRKQA